jgi:hypothetical protein
MSWLKKLFIKSSRQPKPVDIPYSLRWLRKDYDGESFSGCRRLGL